MKKRWAWHQTILVAILLLGAALRVRGMVWTLPYLVDGDEWRVINSGLSIYYFSDPDEYPHYFLRSYPPYRLWEVTLTRAALVTMAGEPVSTTQQALAGRVLSLFYAQLTLVLLYKTGRQLTRQPRVGLIASAVFATWPGVLRYGQTVLADGPALAFFVATIWYTVRATQRRQLNDLAAAAMLGVLTMLAKYNLGTVLLLPGFVGLLELRMRFRAVVLQVIVPLVFVLGAVSAALMATFNPTWIACYFDIAASDTCQAGDAKSVSYNAAGVNAQFLSSSPDLQDIITAFFSFFPTPATLGALCGLAYVFLLWAGADRFVSVTGTLDQGSLRLLAILAILSFVLISVFEFSVARQYMGIMTVLILFLAILFGIPARPGVRRLFFGAFLIVWAIQIPRAWAFTSDRYLPDTRAATVEWFVTHAPSGTFIVSEAFLYEFNPLNGYTSPKVFSVIPAQNAFTLTPESWKAQGIDYLVADEQYAQYGGYYSFPAGRYAFEGVEIVAQFHHPKYAGPARTIFRLPDPCCDETR